MLCKYVLAFAAALSFSTAHAQDWKPARNVDIIGSSGAGAADRQARATQRFLQDDEWKKVQQEFVWVDDFRGAAEARKHLDAEHGLLQKMLADLGVTGKP